ncbi:hypothetical protein, partial [Frankia sp. EI5c]|uniref:hypothetical protein n=1 Tax=Frankia sp. EI5c TaxID=683316 RepID=UPI001F5B1B66
MAGVDPHAIAAADLPRLNLPYADGLITINRVRRAPDSLVCSVAAGDPAAGRIVTSVDFLTIDPPQAARTAVGLVCVADLTAVAVHARYAPTDTAALAVCFAGRLHDARVAHALAGRVVVADHRPELPRPAEGTVTGRGLVRVPHLVTVHHSPTGPTGPTGPGGPGGSRGPRGGPRVPAGVTDRVVWEIMTFDQYLIWLGGAPGPDAGVLERHLGGLLTLAALLRGRCAQVPRRDEVLSA